MIIAGNETKMAKIRGALLEGRKLSGLDALYEFGTFRLAAYIHLLRKSGMPIITYMVDYKCKDGTTTRYAKYWLPPSQHKL